MNIRLWIGVGIVGLAGLGVAVLWKQPTLGKQADGSFIVSSGQRIPAGDIAFKGRPADLAMHPSGQFFAVLNKSGVFLANRQGMLPNTEEVPLGTGAGFHGLKWSADGKRLFASCSNGRLQSFDYDGAKLVLAAKIELQADSKDRNTVPGGMDISADGKKLYVACVNRNAVVEVDLDTNKRLRDIPVQTMPYSVRLAQNGATLVVSNWGGYLPRAGAKTRKSDETDVEIDEVSAAKSGCVSLIDLASGKETLVETGRHPCSIVVHGDLAYVANALDDSISEIDLVAKKVKRTLASKYNGLKVIGSLPNAMQIVGSTLYVCNGGDNALGEIDLKSGNAIGWRPTGFLPIAVAVQKDKDVAYVLNSKGNGSTQNTTQGKPGNAHDFQGTITVLDLTKDIGHETAVVASNNSWNQGPLGMRPRLKVYNGAIKHVIYIIKENRTYDEIYGDLPQGNGDPKLCSLGETVMPNHRKIVQEFTLFDNGYVSGTNSADGHNWSTQGFANDYLERFYVGYSRTYPDDGRDAMAISQSGMIWDAAEKKKKSIRIYGEFMNADKNHWVPRAPKDWFERWEERKSGKYTMTPIAVSDVESVRKYGHPNYHYWPLWQSDQERADIFIKEYSEFSAANKVPNLMVLSLPCDHGEGMNAAYPTPRAMMADNDLALGRIVEAVSNSPQWKETCIFVIEDDAQSGPDHVDGHRTSYMVLSPYTKRKFVDSFVYTTVNMLKSIEMMLGLDPMNKFDTLAKPIDTCFTDTLDLTPYKATPNNVPLDEPNPGRKKPPTPEERYWMDKTTELDWSHVDAPDPYWLNRINWFSIHKGKVAYPSRPGETPGQFDEDED